MNNNWKLLDWEYVCDQAPGIQCAHEHASDRADYGVNFYEFIHTAGGLEDLAQAWWDGLPDDRRRALLAERLTELQSQVEQLILANVPYETRRL